MRPASLSAMALIAACAPTTEFAPPPIVDAAIVDAIDASTNDRPADATPTDAPDDPCDFHARVPLRLRPGIGDNGAQSIPAGTALELLSVTSVPRGSLPRLGVLCGVRVRSTGAEGNVYLDAYEVARCQRSRVSAPDVAEEHRVMVDGVEEVWRVRFTTPPRLPEPLPEEPNCADWNDQNFENRRAVIERLRDGVVIDRLVNPSANVPASDAISEAPLATRVAIYRRVRPSAGPQLTLAESERLPLPTVLSIGDYDHDGRATEFVLPMGFFICGNSSRGVVGLDRKHPRLHLLEWASPAGAHMVGLNIDWEAIRERESGDIITWHCGNHGYNGEDHMRWSPFLGRLRTSHYTVPMRDGCPGER